ncbi:MAG: hypothetical protein GXO89_04990 [Chlorobi bacterium]|nr:hypothetical protein [Chlorobiota bacterium]
MNVQIVFLFVAIAVFVYISLTAIELRKGIVALIFDQSPPVYFEVFPKHMPAHYKKTLNRSEKYYRDLSPKLQRSFESRLMKFKICNAGRPAYDNRNAAPDCLCRC